MTERVLLLVGACTLAASAGVGSAVPVAAAIQEAPDSVSVAELEARLRARPADPNAYILLARAHAERDRPQLAEEVLRAGLQGAAPPGPVRRALVALLVELDRWDDALEALGPLESAPGGRALAARLRTNAGAEAYRAGDAERARGLWEQAQRDDPSLARPALNLASLLAEQGESSSAAALFDSLTARRDAPAEVYGAAAGFWFRRGRWDRAVELAERGVEADPSDAELWELLAEANALRGDWSGSVVASRRAAALLEEPAPAELRLIEANAELGDTAAALAAARALADRDGAPRRALLRAAELARGVGGGDVARLVYERLLTREPDDADALAGAGSAAEARGDTARALKLYRRALEAAGPETAAGPGAALGLLRLERPDAERRRELLRTAAWRGIAALQAVELGMVGALRGVGDAGAAPGAFAARGAKQLLDRRDALGGSVRAVLDTLVLEHEWGGRELDRLRQAYPRSTLLRRYAARLAAERDDPADALAHYDRLLRQEAGDAELHLGRADALEALDSTEVAIAAYTRALELEPENEPAFRALVRLHGDRGTLESLLQRVRRLRLRRPDSAVLIDREIELLHRLGRTLEADSLARAPQSPAVQ